MAAVRGALATAALLVGCAVGLIVMSLWGPPRDGVTAICEAAALFAVSDRAMMLATEGNTRAFVEACVAVFPAVEPEAQILLRRALRDGTLMKDVVRTSDAFNARMTRAPPNLTYSECAGDRPKRDGEIVFDKKRYLAAGIRPLQERTIPVDQVYDAIIHGRTAKFDATKLLPQRMFNITLRDLTARHPHQPVYNDQGWIHPRSRRCWDWLVYLTGSNGKFQQWGPRSFRTKLARSCIIPLLLRFSCPRRSDTLEELSAQYKPFKHNPIPWSMLWDNDGEVEKMLKHIRHRILRVGNLNLRRTPRFAAGFDIAEGLGFGSGFGGELVEHTHSILWIGAAKGGIHSDHQDNVLIQLTGDVQVMVVPASCIGIAKVPLIRDIAGFLTRGMPKNQSRLPFYHVHLRQGEGLVIPSLAQHKIISSDSRRVGLNAFMEPRFGQMQWPTAPANYYLRHRKDILAVRSLFMKTVRQLWDTRKLSYAMHTERVEFV